MALSADRPFVIKNITDQRVISPRFIEGIVLVNIKCMFENKRMLAPTVRVGAKQRGSYHHTKWREYFYRERKAATLPYHYYCEEVDGDWMIALGCNRMTRSWFLADLVDNDIIDQKYRNFHVVAISHDTDRFPYPDRLMVVLGDALLSFHEKYDSLNWDTNIVFFQETLPNDWKLRVERSGLRYRIEPDRYNDYQGNRIRLRDTTK